MMSIKNETLINPDDFETMILKINLMNTTTHAEIRDGKRSYDKKTKNVSEENLKIIIAEFLDDGLLMEIPSKMCAQHHNITIEVSTENVTPPIFFSENLKVKSVEKISAESDLIEARFIQKNEAEWKKIHRIYEKRQEEIRNFINSVKGYEST
jgi:carboxylesterase type B